MFSFVQLVTHANAATIPGRATAGIIKTDGISGTDKKKTANIMHPAFSNAGQVSGLEIWRIEVCKQILRIKLIQISSVQYGPYCFNNSI